MTDIAAYVHPARRHLIEPDAQLSDLGLDLIDLWDIRDTIERRNNVTIDDATLAKWRCVGDVLGAAKITA